MTLTLSPEAAEWMVDGEHGISSEAIFSFLTTGRVSGRGWRNEPHDPDDFRRCELLLRAVPDFRARLSEMAAVSPWWAGLVARWDEIHALIEEEAPGYLANRTGRAPRAYAVMREIEEKTRGQYPGPGHPRR